MKKIMISAKGSDYVTTGEAKAFIKKHNISDPADFSALKVLQKYGLRGSKMTYYKLDDLIVLFNRPAEPQASEKLSVRAYVDGSFNVQTGVYGGAAILVCNDEILATETVTGTKMNSIRNIAGEISAAATAVKLAEELMPDELVIVYDCEGVGKWPTGEYTAKNEYTQKYAEFMNKKRTFAISYEHVKAHSGDRYNEMADDMAVKACGLKTMEQTVPAFTGKRNNINEDVKRVKYQVKNSCITAINEFYEKDKHAFKDYVEIKSGSTDNLSGIRDYLGFKGILTEDELKYIASVTVDMNVALNAMRWTVRGLLAEDAVKKALVDKEIYNRRKS